MMQMSDGSVAVIDALGFRGIWQRYPAETILDRLSALDKLGKVIEGLSQTKMWKSNVRLFESPAPEISVQFLSDAVVFGCAHQNAEPPDDEMHLVRSWAAHALLCQMLHTLLGHAADGEPKLLYRGTVASGRFLIRDRFVLGPAVDEAAGLAGLADGAFVWLAPSALNVHDAAIKKGHSAASWIGERFKNTLIQFPVPLRTGKTIDSQVISPFGGPLQPSESSIASMMEAFGSSADAFDSGALDVLIKAQNTRRFLSHVLSCSQSAP